MSVGLLSLGKAPVVLKQKQKLTSEHCPGGFVSLAKVLHKKRLAMLFPHFLQMDTAGQSHVFMLILGLDNA